MKTSISNIIIVLLFVIYSIVFINSTTNQDGIIYTLGALEKYSVIGLLEAYRIFTASFVNRSFINLVASSLVIYNIGNLIEFKLGKIKLLVVLVLGSIFCNTVFLLIGNDILCGTYSGAFALIGCYVTLIIKDKNNYTKTSRNIILIFIICGIYLYFYDHTSNVLISSLGFFIGVILNIDYLFKLLAVIFLFTSCSKIDIKISDDEILKENNVVAQNTQVSITTTSPTTIEKVEKPIIDGFLQYVDKDRDFKIQYPINYKRFDKTNLELEENKNLLKSKIGEQAYEQILLNINNTSSIWYDFEDSNDDYPDNLMLIIAEMPPLNASFIKFEDFQRILTSDFAEQNKKNNIKTNVLTEGELLSVGDNKFVIFHYLQKVKDVDFSYYQAFTTHKGFIYHLTFTSKQDRFNKDLINKILETVEIN